MLVRNVGIMEKKMETTGIIKGLQGIYWGSVGIMEKKKEATVSDSGLWFRGVIRV